MTEQQTPPPDEEGELTEAILALLALNASMEATAAALSAVLLVPVSLCLKFLQQLGKAALTAFRRATVKPKEKSAEKIADLANLRYRAAFIKNALRRIWKAPDTKLALTRELAIIHARENIRVNALCPGPLRTELLMSYLNTEEKKQRRLVHIPMGRFGEAKEIARAALFLASDESSYITGTDFLVDGGITAAYVTPL